MIKVDNAVILAAGASSRFAPLSYERHKALIEVKGEVLIERQIRQLREGGVKRYICSYWLQKRTVLIPCGEIWCEACAQ